MEKTSASQEVVDKSNNNSKPALNNRKEVTKKSHNN